MDKLGKIILGNKTKKKFLKTLIPDEFQETVYEHTEYWSCLVIGERLKKEAWQQVKDDMAKELGDNLLEVHSIVDNGRQFIVFLKKD